MYLLQKIVITVLPFSCKYQRSWFLSC